MAKVNKAPKSATLNAAEIMASVQSAIRDSLMALVKGAVANAAASARLNEKRQGTYVNAVIAGISANGDVVLFNAACDTLMDDIRLNREGLAVSIKAKKANKTGENGEVRYLVPSALSAAKSYIGSALSFGVALIDAEGQPRSYGEVRKDVDAANAEKARESETVEQREIREIGEVCDLIKARAEREKVPANNVALHKALASLWSALNPKPATVADAGTQVEAAATPTKSSAKAAA